MKENITYIVLFLTATTALLLFSNFLNKISILDECVKPQTTTPDFDTLTPALVDITSLIGTI